MCQSDDDGVLVVKEGLGDPTLPSSCVSVPWIVTWPRLGQIVMVLLLFRHLRRLRCRCRRSPPLVLRVLCLRPSSSGGLSFALMFREGAGVMVGRVAPAPGVRRSS